MYIAIIYVTTDILWRSEKIVWTKAPFVKSEALECCLRPQRIAPASTALVWMSLRGKSFSIARDSHKKEYSTSLSSFSNGLFNKKDCISRLMCLQWNTFASYSCRTNLCDNLTCKRSNNVLMLMLSCYVSTHGVIACKCSRAEGTRYANTLMTLSNMSS